MVAVNVPMNMIYSASRQLEVRNTRMYTLIF